MSVFARWFARRVGQAEGERRAALPAGDGITLGTTRDGEAITMPQFDGTTAATGLIMGASGAGKSALAGNWIATAIVSGRDDERADSWLVVDPKGDTILSVMQNLGRDAPAILQSGRIRYINPFSGPFPFNILRAPLGRVPADLRARQLSLLTGILTAGAGMRTDGGIGARQLDSTSIVYTAITELVGKYPDASLLWAVDAFTPEGLKLLAREASPRLREALLQKMPDELMIGCAARSRLAWANFASLATSTSASSCVDFADLTSPGAITLIDLGDPLGGSEVRSFYASVLVQLIVDHLLSNRPSPFDGHHCQLVIEEASQVAGVLGQTIETIAQTGRSRRLGATVLLQGAQAIDRASPGLLETLVANSPTVISGRLGSASDAERFGRTVAPQVGGGQDARSMQMRLAASLANLRQREFYALRAGERKKFRSADVDVLGGQEAFRRHAKVIAEIKDRYVIRDEKPKLTLREALGSAPSPAKKAPPKEVPPAKADEVAEPRAAVRPTSTQPMAESKGRTRWG